MYMGECCINSREYAVGRLFKAMLNVRVYEKLADICLSVLSACSRTLMLRKAMRRFSAQSLRHRSIFVVYPWNIEEST